MGFAIARAAWRRGAQARIVAGPSSIATPYGGRAHDDVVSARELLTETSRNFPWSTTLVMAAAIADFRPAHPAEHKVKKNPKGLTLEMESIADEMPRIAAKKGNRILVGFAAETQDLESNARDKLKRKHLDLIVANNVTMEGAGFAVDTNIVTIYGADGAAANHPKLTKDEVADLILDRVPLAHCVCANPGRAPFARLSDLDFPLSRACGAGPAERPHFGRGQGTSLKLVPRRW